MSEIRNIELEDSKGNRYYFHTDASIVKYKDTTVEEQLDKITQSLIDSAITNDDLITPSLIEGFELINGYYVKTNENFVYVNLNFKGTFANSTWVKFFDLPVGYRPSKEKMINCVALDSSDNSLIQNVVARIQPDGIYIYNPNSIENIIIYIDKIFLAEE